MLNSAQTTNSPGSIGYFNIFLIGFWIPFSKQGKKNTFNLLWWWSKRGKKKEKSLINDSDSLKKRKEKRKLSMPCLRASFISDYTINNCVVLCCSVISICTQFTCCLMSIINWHTLEKTHRPLEDGRLLKCRKKETLLSLFSFSFFLPSFHFGIT